MLIRFALAALSVNSIAVAHSATPLHVSVHSVDQNN
jgi:hypothetical protein